MPVWKTGKYLLLACGVMLAQHAAAAPEVIVVTDEEGRFCFRARLEPDRFKADLTWKPDASHALLDPGARTLAFDLSRKPLALHFDPSPRIVRLDVPTAKFEAVAVVDDDATPPALSNASLPRR